MQTCHGSLIKQNTEKEKNKNHNLSFFFYPNINPIQHNIHTYSCIFSPLYIFYGVTYYKKYVHLNNILLWLFIIYLWCLFSLSLHIHHKAKKSFAHFSVQCVVEEKKNMCLVIVCTSIAFMDISVCAYQWLSVQSLSLHFMQLICWEKRKKVTELRFTKNFFDCDIWNSFFFFLLRKRKTGWSQFELIKPSTS